MSSDETNVRVKPVFFKSSDVPQENNNWLNTWEICIAASEVVKEINAEKKFECIDAAQRIGGLWRIYLFDEAARAKLLSEGVTLRGQQVELRERNPFLVGSGFEDVETTRLFIRNVPLSFDNNSIENVLKNNGVQMVNPLKYSKARDPNGKLTNFRTGDRFVDIVVPDQALPKTISVGDFTAHLYHKEQKQTANSIECGNCMQIGHRRKECPNEIVCYDCRQVGHKKGDKECPSGKDLFDEDDAFSDAHSETSYTAEAATGHVSENEGDNESENERQKMRKV